MYQRIISVACGLLAGVAGALLVGAVKHVDAPLPEKPTTLSRLPAAPIVPPSWNPAFLNRLASLESKVSELAQRQELESQSASPAIQEPKEEREVTRAVQYQAELEHHDKLLADHRLERYDAKWSAAQTSITRETLAGMSKDGNLSVVDVDCRTVTCVARVSFASPDDALEWLHSNDLPSLSQGTSGLEAIPTPPTSPGRYELAVMLFR